MAALKFPIEVAFIDTALSLRTRDHIKLSKAHTRVSDLELGNHEMLEKRSVIGCKVRPVPRSARLPLMRISLPARCHIRICPALRPSPHCTIQSFRLSPIPTSSLPSHAFSPGLTLFFPLSLFHSFLLSISLSYFLSLFLTFFLSFFLSFSLSFLLSFSLFFSHSFFFLSLCFFLTLSISFCFFLPFLSFLSLSASLFFLPLFRQLCLIYYISYFSVSFSSFQPFLRLHPLHHISPFLGAISRAEFITRLYCSAWRFLTKDPWPPGWEPLIYHPPV